MANTVYEPMKGEAFYNATENAIRLAQIVNNKVTFTFNEIIITVNAKSYADDISHIYYLQFQIRRLENQLK